MQRQLESPLPRNASSADLHTLDCGSGDDLGPPRKIDEVEAGIRQRACSDGRCWPLQLIGNGLAKVGGDHGVRGT